MVYCYFIYLSSTFNIILANKLLKVKTRAFLTMFDDLLCLQLTITAVRLMRLTLGNSS